MRCFWMILFCLFYFNIGRTASDTTVFFIAVTGNDAFNGSILQPYRTFEGAISKIRTLKSTDLKDKTVIVYIRGGVYYIKNSIELDERDSFTKKHPLIFKAYKKEYVEINGGARIDVKNVVKVTDQSILTKLPENIRNKIFEVDLKKLGITNYGLIRSSGFRRPYMPAPIEVFANKEPMTISRWPNDSSVRIHTVLDRNGEIQYIDDRPKRWIKAKDCWIGGYFCWAWADDQLPVRLIDTIRRTIRTTEGTMFGFESGKDFQRWYIYNLLEEIDAEGEYFIDRQAGKLYFYSNNIKSLQLLEVSMLEEPIISVKGAKNIQFQHVNIENTRGMGGYMERSTNVIFESCTFRNIGMIAVNIGQGIEPFAQYVHNGTGKPASGIVGSLYEHLYENTDFDRQAGVGNGIMQCKIYNIGNGGVIIGGGNRKTLTSAGNFVINCDIYKTNRLGKTYKGCVNIDGVGNIVRSNHLHVASQMAVYMYGNNHLVEYNEIDSVCQEAEDMGAVYMGRDPSQTGNILRYNYLHHILPKREDYRLAGFYFDDGQIAQRIYGNIFFKVGSESFGAIFFNGGHHFNIYNNVFVTCKTAIGNLLWPEKLWRENLSSELIQNRLYKAININGPDFKQQFPDLSKTVNEYSMVSTVSDNLAYNCKNFCASYFIQTGNSLFKSNPGFTFYKSGELKLPSNKQLILKYLHINSTDFKKIGLQNLKVGNSFTVSGL